MEDKIEFVLNSVKNKDEVKATTTLKFKKDLVDILVNNAFEGDILEIGTSAGHTTALFCAIAELKNKHVYSFEHNLDNVREAEKRCSEYGFSNYSIIHMDVYKNEWLMALEKANPNSKAIGCVFIDCVHTKECFSQDLERAVWISSGVENPIIIAHDYGLITKEGDGIKIVLDENPNKYRIVSYMGEEDNWNKLGSGKVVDWEGVRISILE